MDPKEFKTDRGTIHYWTNKLQRERATLVLLPGLTADHRLFEKQIDSLSDKYNILVWDAPGHGLSRPFRLDFSLFDKAQWLHDILHTEGIQKPILVGQSMGGYVAQCYLQLFPNEAGGFVSIDSAPLQKRYMAEWEIWSLKHTETMYRWYPWKALQKAGSKGCAVSQYGQQLMFQMMQDFTHEEYAALAAHGYRILAEAIETNLPFEISCPALLICGEQDKAGSAKRYNREWAKQTGLPLHWIPDAGHNANTDQPDWVNKLIQQFCKTVL